MTSFEKALSSYFTSNRHCTRIGGHHHAAHARRSALLARGNVNQAVALKRAAAAPDADQGESSKQK